MYLSTYFHEENSKGGLVFSFNVDARRALQKQYAINNVAYSDTTLENGGCSVEYDADYEGGVLFTTFSDLTSLPPDDECRQIAKALGFSERYGDQFTLNVNIEAFMNAVAINTGINKLHEMEFLVSPGEGRPTIDGNVAATTDFTGTLEYDVEAMISMSSEVKSLLRADEPFQVHQVRSEEDKLRSRESIVESIARKQDRLLNKQGESYRRSLAHDQFKQYYNPYVDAMDLLHW